VKKQACYESSLTEKADIVLPVTTWSEQEGHYINLDGRMQKAEKAITPPEGVRDHVSVLGEVARRTDVKVEADWQKAVLGRKSSVSLN
jgi:NADH dehydrogenase/NADH:ubiquinone oxidoreductase subunit G